MPLVSGSRCPERGNVRIATYNVNGINALSVPSRARGSKRRQRPATPSAEATALGLYGENRARGGRGYENMASLSKTARSFGKHRGRDTKRLAASVYDVDP